MPSGYTVISWADFMWGGTPPAITDFYLCFDDMEIWIFEMYSVDGHVTMTKEVL